MTYVVINLPNGKYGVVDYSTKRYDITTWKSKKSAQNRADKLNKPFSGLLQD